MPYIHEHTKHYVDTLQLSVVITLLDECKAFVGANVSKNHVYVLVCIRTCMRTCMSKWASLRMAEDSICL